MVLGVFLSLSFLDGELGMAVRRVPYRVVRIRSVNSCKVLKHGWHMWTHSKHSKGSD